MKLQIYLAFITTALFAANTLPLLAATNKADPITADELLPLLPEISLQILNSALKAQGYHSLEGSNITQSTLKTLWGDWTGNWPTDKLHHCNDIESFHSLTFQQLDKQKNYSPAAKTVQAYLLHQHLCHDLQTPIPKKNSNAEKHYKQLMSMEKTLGKIASQPTYFFFCGVAILIVTSISMCTADSYGRPSYYQ